MKESYMKSAASHHSPESCLDEPQGSGEALTGGNTGAVLSSEITPIRRQTLLDERECNISSNKRRDTAGFGGVLDLQHVWTLSARESGEPASSLSQRQKARGWCQ
jgi:hypothetical protein